MREVLSLFAEKADRSLKVQAMPKWMFPVVGLINSDVRELKEMLYQWERPFHVDSTKFSERFWSDATSFEDGLSATAAYFLAD